MGTRSVEIEQPKGIFPVETVGSDHFSLDVEIEGLPYVFKGKLPNTPSAFSLSVHIPDPAWKQSSPLLLESGFPAGKRGSPAAEEAWSHFFEDGQIGYVNLKDTRIYGIADLRLDYISSDTWLLPQPSPHFDAHGVGRFLMNNLLTLLDVKGWSVYLEALANGRLSQKAICDWYVRKGFKWEANVGIRPPQQPDLTQPITKALGVV